MVAPGRTEDIPSLTSIRGIAAVWVVVYHYPIVATLPELSPFVEDLVHTGHFAVPLFFILSGYVLGMRYRTAFLEPSTKKLLRFWWLRLGRIYPVHACMLTIYLPVFARHGWSNQQGLNLRSFLANCFLTHAWGWEFHVSWNYPAWSISSEWFAYLLFPPLTILLSKCSKAGLYAITSVFCIAAILVYAHEDLIAFKGLAVVVPTFAGGVGLAMLLPPHSWKNISPYCIEASLLLIVAVPYFLTPSAYQSAAFIFLFFLIVSLLGAIGKRAHAVWHHPTIVYLGDVSYSLYMTHAFVLLCWSRSAIDEYYTDKSLFTRSLAMFVLLAITLCAAIAMHHGIERPMRQLSRKPVANRQSKTVEV